MKYEERRKEGNSHTRLEGAGHRVRPVLLGHKMVNIALPVYSEAVNLPALEWK